MAKYLLFYVLIVFFFSTASINGEDTIDKRTVPLSKPSISTQPVTNVKSVNADSLVVVAQQDINNYNKSVEIKEKSDLQVLEQNKKLLAYEKKENELIKAVIAKQKSKSNKNINKTINTIDSVCVKYKNPLFGKKYCIEYATIYTLTIEGKTIKLKEIK